MDNIMSKIEPAKTRVKKDSQLIIRINSRERNSFVSQCGELDTSAAREIRKFIRQFMEENTTEKQEPVTAVNQREEVQRPQELMSANNIRSSTHQLRSGNYFSSKEYEKI